MNSKIILAFILIISAVILCGCENLGKNTRQTAKNLNSVFLDGYDKDLYTSR